MLCCAVGNSDVLRRAEIRILSLTNYEGYSRRTRLLGCLACTRQSRRARHCNSLSSLYEHSEVADEMRCFCCREEVEVGGEGRRMRVCVGGGAKKSLMLDQAARGGQGRGDSRGRGRGSQIFMPTHIRRPFFGAPNRKQQSISTENSPSHL